MVHNNKSVAGSFFSKTITVIEKFIVGPEGTVVFLAVLERSLKTSNSLQIFQSILDSENQHRKKNQVLYQLLFPHPDQYTITI